MWRSWREEAIKTRAKPISIKICSIALIKTTNGSIQLSQLRLRSFERNNSNFN